MMNKRGALEPDKWLIGLVLFTIVVITGLLFMQDLDTAYPDVTFDERGFGDNASFNITDDMYDLSQDIKDAAGVTETSEDATEDSLFKGAYKAITFLGNSYVLVGDVMDSIMKVVPVPTIFKTLAITIVVILIGFAIVYLMFRFQPRR